MKIMFTVPRDIFLHAVTFCCVLHLDVIRSQIELKLKLKTEHFLMSGYNAGPIPIYTVVPYCVIHPNHTIHIMRSVI